MARDSLTPPPTPPDPRGLRLSAVLLGYGVAAVLGAGLATAFDRSPVSGPSWFPLEPLSAGAVSVGLGLLVGVAVVAATPPLVRRVRAARALHDAIRPVLVGTSDGELLLMAFSSGIGEELFFRGFLAQIAGIGASSLLFGLMHQVRGRGRWFWVATAALLGLVFATIFRLTGSLLGAVVAHVLVNAANLRLIRDGRALDAGEAKTPQERPR